MPVPQWMELSQTAKTLGTTPFCVLLACFAILLGEHSGNPEVIVGAPFSTRRTIASHDLCGFFVNTLPIVLPATLRDFRVHCAEVSAGVRTAQRCQSVPFDTLVARTVRKRTDNRNPIFQCVFAMQDVMANTRQLAPGNVIRLEWPHSGAAKFDLLLAAKPVNDGLILQLEWDADLLTDSFATDFFTEYQQLLHRVTTGSSGMAEAAT